MKATLEEIIEAYGSRQVSVKTRGANENSAFVPPCHNGNGTSARSALHSATDAALKSAECDLSKAIEALFKAKTEVDELRKINAMF